VNYPAWVRERYLAPLDGIPERVLTLARDLTATAPTPVRSRPCVGNVSAKISVHARCARAAAESRCRGLFSVRRQTRLLRLLRDGDGRAGARGGLARAARRRLRARLLQRFHRAIHRHRSGRTLLGRKSIFPTLAGSNSEPTASRAPIERTAERRKSKSSNCRPIQNRICSNADPERMARVVVATRNVCPRLALSGRRLVTARYLRLRWMSPPDAIATGVFRASRASRSGWVYPRARRTRRAKLARCCAHISRRYRAQGAPARCGKVSDARVDTLTALYVQAAYSPRAPANKIVRARGARGANCGGGCGLRGRGGIARK